MKNSHDTLGNQTHDLLACSAVPQPTVPPRAPKYWTVILVNIFAVLNLTFLIFAGPRQTIHIVSGM